MVSITVVLALSLIVGFSFGSPIISNHYDSGNEIENIPEETTDSELSSFISDRISSIDDSLIQSGLKRLMYKQDIAMYQEIVNNASQDSQAAIENAKKKLINNPETRFYLMKFAMTSDDVFFNILSKYEEWKNFQTILIEMYRDYLQTYG